MASSGVHHWRSDGFALGVWLRAIAISLLAFATVAFLTQRLWATAFVLAGIALLIGLDLRRSVTAADRVMAQFVDGLFSGSDDRPLPQAGARRLHQAIDRALDRQHARRVESQRRLDFAEALADNVAAALFVIDPSGAVILANRAARLAFGETDLRLDRIESLGPVAAARLLSLHPGEREILQLADDRSMLASVTRFSAPGGAALKLIALQGVPGQLDVVVLKAWQDLVRVLAHEMMNSLTPICSLGDSIATRARRAGDNAETRAEIAEAAEVISQRGARLIDFVERYRQLAELPPVVRSRFAAQAFVAGLDRLTQPMMTDAGVAYTSEVAPDLVLEADAALIEQALINLLKNARDAVRGRPDGQVWLRCRAEGEEIVLSVEDNGAGLQGDVEQAFVPFYSTKPGGSGIGLTLARQIALAHGGRLEHARRAPHGSVFRLSLRAG